MSKPIGAPACFAAASVFSQDSTICQGCSAFADCSAASLETLMAIKSIINVDDLLKRHAVARKAAMIAKQAIDEAAAAEMPPGNLERPVEVRPVERKTQVVPIKFDVSPDENVVLARMPVKPREIALRMLKANDVEGIRLALTEKRNYYAERGPSFLRVAMTMLLNGGFSKLTLRKTFEAELSWTEGTAASHVGIAVAILVGFKFAQEKSSQFTLMPEVGE